MTRLVALSARAVADPSLSQRLAFPPFDQSWISPSPGAPTFSLLTTIWEPPAKVYIHASTVKESPAAMSRDGASGTSTFWPAPLRTSMPSINPGLAWSCTSTTEEWLPFPVESRCAPGAASSKCWTML